MTAPNDALVRNGSRVLTWIGIIAQLMETRAAKVLAAHAMPFPQYVMLNHFSHQPDAPKTITGIARALQQPQPGVTKTVQKMVARRFLRVAPAPEDGRSKLLYLTAKGREAHTKALAALAPAFADLFAGWKPAELDELFGKLDRLKVWLDTKGRE